MEARTIAEDCVVSFHYTLKDVSGELIDSSEGAEPLRYLHGHQNIIVGLENALTGKSVGDELKVAIAPEEAYGPMEPDLIQSLPLSAFEAPEGQTIEAGMQFQLEDEFGMARVFLIEEVTEDRVVVNGNHPLAGVELHFDVLVEDIRDASEQEIAHGHVHHGDCEGHEGDDSDDEG